MVTIGKLKGKFELLGKYAKADFTHGSGANYDQKTTEVNFNYVIKQFNARVMSFYEDAGFQQRETPISGRRESASRSRFDASFSISEMKESVYEM